MKLISLLILSLISLSSFAQSQTEAELIATFMNAEKKALVADNMTLTNEEAATFWKLYDAYSEERKDITSNKSAAASYYLKKYNGITDEEINKAVNASFYNQSMEQKLMKKYYKKIKKELGTKTAARFFMVEEQIQMIVRATLWGQLPLVNTHVGKEPQK